MRTIRRYTFFVILLFIAVPLYQCTGSNKNKKDIDESSLKGYDTVSSNLTIREARLKLFEALEPFHRFLDTIVDTEKKCPLYNEKSSGFVLSKYEDDEMYPIGIGSIDVFNYDYSEAIGVFIYRGHQFVCDDMLSGLMIETNDSIDIKYHFDEEFDLYWHTIDDRGSAWYFKYENNHITLTGHYACPPDV